MPKYFFAPSQKHGDVIALDDALAHHLFRVLRLRDGASVILCDGAGVDYATVLRGGTAVVAGEQPCRTELPASITLYQALPKGDKFETIIQKCVELGAARIVPVYTAHSLAKHAEKKQPRWQKIAESAAGQSMRGMIPQVSTPMDFAAALREKTAGAANTALWLAAFAPSERPAPVVSLRALLDAAARPFPSIGLWVGAEGGFSAEETAGLLSAGAHSVSLGPRVLRTETAAPALLAQISLLLEDV